MKTEDVKATITIISLFLGLPLAILFLRDRFHRWKFKRPMFWLVLPLLLAFAVLMPLCIEPWTIGRVVIMAGIELAVIFMLLGLFGFGWAFRALGGLIFLAYSSYLVSEFVFSDQSFTLHGRRSNASPGNALLGFVLIGLPALWFAIMGRRSHPEPSGEELAAARKEFEDRLLQPDWEFYERHLQRSAPAALRQLFADRKLVTMQGLEGNNGCDINEFQPIDEDGLTEIPGPNGLEVVAIATNEFGDAIYLRPGASENDVVYVTYHDGGDTEVFAESVEAMVGKLKKAISDNG